jgi:general secretion pathway protein F
MGMAMIYPFVVLSVAYILLLFTIFRIIPTVHAAYEDLTLEPAPLLRSLVWLGQSAPIWCLVVPALFLLAIGVWWYRPGRAARSAAWSSGGGLLSAPWPTAARTWRDGRLATFAEILSLLVHQNVPLEEAIVLAADASGDQQLKRGARELAERYRRGEVVTQRDQIPSGFPPLLGWLLAAGPRRIGLGPALESTAAHYRQRTADAATWTAIYTPILLSAVLGGSVTLVQALLIFGPIIQLLYDLG